MIDSVWNLLFGCSHRHLTRPVTPVNKAGVPHGGTYVVCLECGKQFPYDLKEMRIGKPIPPSHEASVVQPKPPVPRRTKVKYAVWASLPAALIVGAVWKKNHRGGAAGQDRGAKP